MAYFIYTYIYNRLNIILTSSLKHYYQNHQVKYAKLKKKGEINVMKSESIIYFFRLIERLP